MDFKLLLKNDSVIVETSAPESSKQGIDMPLTITLEVGHLPIAFPKTLSLIVSGVGPLLVLPPLAWSSARVDFSFPFLFYGDNLLLDVSYFDN